jgi:hypothetical protein
MAVDTFQSNDHGPELRAEGSVHVEARSTLVLISR